MSETIGHSALTVTPDQQRSTRDILDGLREPVWQSAPDDREALLEALEMATAEKTVLEDADREAHRLRPLSEWTEENGSVLVYRVGPGKPGDPMIRIPQPAEESHFTHWLRLPDSAKLWTDSEAEK